MYDGHYVVYKLTDNETEKVFHIGKYSNKTTAERITAESKANNVRLEIIFSDDDLSDVTRRIRLLKIKYKVSMESNLNTKKFKIKDRKKQARGTNGKENYFIDYKIENGSYVPYRIETPLEFLTNQA